MNSTRQETVPTVKRRPAEGDVVVSRTSGRLYRVTELHRNGYDRVHTIGVTSVENGLPNGFSPDEVLTVAAAYAKNLPTGEPR